MNERIQVQSMGNLICDNPHCDYESPAKTESVEELKTHIGEPCPKCGESLLTEEDFKMTEDVFKYIEFVNGLTEEEFEKFTELCNKYTEEEKFGKIQELIDKHKEGDMVPFSIKVHDGVDFKIGGEDV